MIRRPPRSTRTDTLFPYTTLFRSAFDDRLHGTPPTQLFFPGYRPKVAVETRTIVPLVQGIAPRRERVSLSSLVALAGFRRLAPFIYSPIKKVLEGSAGAMMLPRSEERRVGKECVSTCRSRWSPYHSQKKHKRSNTIKTKQTKH